MPEIKFDPPNVKTTVVGDVVFIDTHGIFKSLGVGAVGAEYPPLIIYHSGNQGLMSTPPHVRSKS